MEADRLSSEVVALSAVSHSCAKEQCSRLKCRVQYLCLASSLVREGWHERLARQPSLARDCCKGKRTKISVTWNIEISDWGFSLEVASEEQLSKGHIWFFSKYNMERCCFQLYYEKHFQQPQLGKRITVSLRTARSRRFVCSWNCPRNYGPGAVAGHVPPLPWVRFRV